MGLPFADNALPGIACLFGSPFFYGDTAPCFTQRGVLMATNPLLVSRPEAGQTVTLTPEASNDALNQAFSADEAVPEHVATIRFSGRSA